MHIPIFGRSLRYEEFYANLLHANLPCLFDDSLTHDWPSRGLWRSNSTINIDEIIRPFKGNICVADCSGTEFGTHPTLEMSTNEYLTYWNLHNNGNDDRLLYLKDWHYFKTCPSPSIYRIPQYFSSDWLNEFSYFRTDLSDDFKFVYIGPKGTWTPLHADVYCSYSWSSNVVGNKRWWIFPPGEEKKLLSADGKIPHDIRDYELAKPEDFTSSLPRCFIFDQLDGQTFFVPSGWYHQVVNITDCVSINHNWLNACNAKLVWKHLQNQLKIVKISTSDVKSTPGWDEACQTCLKAWEGWNYSEFFLLLKYILISRWFLLSVDQVKSRLPTSSGTADDSYSKFSMLQYQVDLLLSGLSESSPQLVTFLQAESRSDNSLADHLLDSPLEAADTYQTDAPLAPDWIRRHELDQCSQIIKLFLCDHDVQKLGLHTNSVVSWLWKKSHLY